MERVPDAAALQKLEQAMIIGRQQTLPCRAYVLDPQPNVPPPDPPIRFRKKLPDNSTRLELVEGKNHQVRRVTAAVRHPTLRLIRVQFGLLGRGNLTPGENQLLSQAERRLLFNRS